MINEGMKKMIENNALGLASVDESGSPHNIAVGFVKVVSDNELVISNNYIEKTIDLNEQLISHPVATFFIRVEGDSMIGAGIFPDDVLIVDRAMNAVNNNVIVAVLNSELTVKRLRITDEYWSLVPDNPAYPEIIITEDTDFTVWGVVTYCIHKL